ncbi:hypothetical protein CONLIGDRAFT_387922 [Coniochaeta ligniaria NRRL 30616]|uniref:Uncharacterized protein n=1 Tax=Coniochaeta ligniaria NRRL 30616 TaxID=1408157 RepID=A0A1J7J5N0_9PEZI|nr:hypothetical protein CONLIGDRAFT_387922 [Coniochaeta ligniaria NRRL 30616]
MHLTTSTTSLLLGFMSVCATAPAEEVGLALPSTCTKKTASCHTYTAYTTPAACPKIGCPELTALICPMYISISTSHVPCSTDCCPKTGTKTVTTSCPTCPTGCVIPTETVTMTTGCKTTAAPVVTGTAGGPSVTLITGGGGANVTFTPGRM